MNRAIHILVVLIMLLTISEQGSAETRMCGTFSAGSIQLVVDANVVAQNVMYAKTYHATPHEYNAQRLIELFWPEYDISNIMNTKTIRDQYVERDGVPLILEIYEYANRRLLISNWGYISFVTEYGNEWSGSNITASRIVDSNHSISSEYVDSYLFNILRAAEYEAQCVRISDYGVHEINEAGSELMFNVYDYVITMDEIYCENHSYLTALSNDDFSIPAQYVQIQCSEQAVLNVTMTLYDVIAEGEYMTVISPQSAIEALVDELSWYLATDTVTIQSVVFEYVMIPIRGSTRTFQYVPAWKLQTSESSWLPYNHMDGTAYRFNAFDGMVIE